MTREISYKGVESRGLNYFFCMPLLQRSFQSTLHHIGVKHGKNLYRKRFIPVVEL